MNSNIKNIAEQYGYTDNGVGFGAFRAQPLHYGHILTINNMLSACQISIIGLGSCQESGTLKNPFTPDVRKKMITNVFGNKVKFVQLVDIGAKFPKEWVDYCIGKIRSIGLPEPNMCFSGSIADEGWYTDHFFPANFPGTEKPTQIDSSGRKRIIFSSERHETGIPSATELRSLIIQRNDEWKRWVHESNHQLIEDQFPDHLRVPKSTTNLKGK